MRKALVLSIAVHAGFFGLARPLASRLAAAAPAPAPLAPPTDVWSGSTPELPFAGAGGPVYDVSLDPPSTGGAPSPAEPAPAAPPPPVQAPVAAPLPVPDPAPAPAPPPPRVRPSATASASAPPRPPPSASPSATTSPAPSSSAVATPAPPRKHRPRPEGPVAERPATSSSPPAGPGGGGSAGGAFGAEGAASVRDLGRAFTRSIPPANDSNPVWADAPLGDAGTLQVAVHVDESGHITSAEPRGDNPPRALVSLLRRTIPLLQAGTFAVREGTVSEGTQILEIRAVVSDVGDAELSSADRLSWEYARGRGKAKFTQTSGRRVEVTVKVLRVEAR